MCKMTENKNVMEMMVLHEVSEWSMYCVGRYRVREYKAKEVHGS